MPLLPASLAGWRLATMLLIRRHARRNWPEVYGHVDGDRLAATMRRMVGPFLGFICMPLIFLINLQAYPAIVATFYGSAAFATFIASRTLARAIDQICNGAYAVLFNEFAYADLSREREFVIGLVGATTLVIGALAAASLIFLATLGSVIFKLWTIGKVAYSLPLVLLFGLAACARCLALPSASLIASRNRHVPVTVISLVTSSLLVCCGVVLGLSRVWFVWLAGCTLVAEVIQLAATLAVTARMLELGLLAYIHRVAGSAPRFVGVVVRTVAARLPGGAKSRAAE
jgi:O-antigen/teichoic acid export membrane protein